MCVPEWTCGGPADLGLGIPADRTAGRRYWICIRRRKRRRNRFPVVVWIHGGGWSFGCKEEHRAIGLARRGGGGGGRVSNYRLLHEGHWPTEIEDCRAAVAFSRREAGRFHLESEAGLGRRGFGRGPFGGFNGDDGFAGGRTRVFGIGLFWTERLVDDALELALARSD